MKTFPSIALALVLLFAFAHPAASHQFKPVEPEPDHALYVLARILYPIGDLLDHVFFGAHEEEDATEEAVEEQTPAKPKYNFSPRKTHSEQSQEENP